MRKPNAVCKKCEKSFYARPGALLQGNGKYCSWKCYSDAKGHPEQYPVIKTCVRCKKNFDVFSSRQRKRKFCSKRCAAIANNSMRELKHSAQWQFRDRLVKKYGFKCMVPGCNYDKFVDAHHIEGKANGGKHTVENGILLCPNHHKESDCGMIDIQTLRQYVVNTVKL